MQLILLSGGAAEGLVSELRHEFQISTGCVIAGAFGSVGAMREKLLAGAPADLIVLTAPLIAELARSGHVRSGSAVDIGLVQTGLAVRAGDPAPPVGDAQALRCALLTAEAIHFPDPKLATAGIHFAKVLDGLGLADTLRTRLRPAPNGAAAMRALAAASEPRAIGCTQVTEILNTPGIAFAGPLPKPFELVSLYTAAVCTRAQLPGQAARLAALLAGDAARHKREQAGFGPLA